jgi:hypothetical protein
MVAGLILIGLGVLFLLGQFVQIEIWSFLWPLLIIGVGALFFGGMIIGGRAAGSLAIPGSIITTVGLILLVQNTFGHWETWSYAWTLILIGVGFGLWLRGTWEGERSTQQAGSRVMGIGLVFFLVFGAFFELGFGFGFGWASGLVWPLGLIAVGIYLLFHRRRGRRPLTAFEGTTASSAGSEKSADQNDHD